MLTYDELKERLGGEGEIAYVSFEFWKTRQLSMLPEGTIHDHPEHPVWDELRAFQHGWLACQEYYEINP
jgi:hypothetical protein